jgi:Holliday junction DNA helicase RuvB
MVVELRPSRLDDIIGNEGLKECLKINLAAAKQEKRPIPHTLFKGHYGCGKTTFARAVANEQGGTFYEINAASIRDHVDLLNYFVRIKKGDVLFIDEIHRLKKKFGELCYPVMEDFKFSISIDSDAFGSIKISAEESQTINQFLNRNVEPFTMIGATTDPGNMPGPLKSRFENEYSVHTYTEEDISKIIRRSANLLKIKLDEEAITQVAKRSKNIPRLANSRIKWIRDYALSKNKTTITPADVVLAMGLQSIDENGYDQDDRFYLEIVEEMQPIGVQGIAARMGTTMESITKFIEPHLLNTGKIKITTQGRVLSTFAQDWENALAGINLI